MLFYEVDKDALALLRAMKDYHEHHNPEDAPFSEGTLLAPELAAEHAGLETDTLRYERALGYLVREGALVKNELARCRGWTSTGLPSEGWSC